MRDDSSWGDQFIAAHLIKSESDILGKVFEESELPQSTINHVIAYSLHLILRVSGLDCVELLLEDLLSEYLQHPHRQLFLECEEPLPSQYFLGGILEE